MLTLLKDGAIGEVIQAQWLSDYFKEDPPGSRHAPPQAVALWSTRGHWVDLIRYLLGEVAEVQRFANRRALKLMKPSGACAYKVGALASLNITLGSPPALT